MAITGGSGDLRRNRLRLLLASSSVAALFVGAGAPPALADGCYAGPFPYTNSAHVDCIVVDNTVFSGNLVNSGTGTINPGEPTGILVENNSTINGSISNAGMILANGTGILINSNSWVTNGITNSNSIWSATSHGIVVENVLLFGSTSGGGISNSGAIWAELRGINVNLVSTFLGGISNSGTITAGDIGIYVDDVSTFAGGVANSGTITAGIFGIEIGSPPTFVSTFLGGVTNRGLINADFGILVETGVTNFFGGITNTGTIADGAIGIAVGGLVDPPLLISTFSGGISNSGTISLENTGIFVDNVSTFSGGIANSGTISATNYGIVVGEEEVGAVSTFLGGISNSGTIVADTGIYVGPGVTKFFGGITNSGKIADGIIGIAVGRAEIDPLISAFSGGINNSGTISLENTGIWVDNVSTFSGGIVNSGTISATYLGIAVGAELASLSTFLDGISNSGTIVAHTGIYIGQGVTNFFGGITNSGTILDLRGGAGIRVEGGVGAAAISIFSGGISNSGFISGSSAGIFVDNVSTFSGGIANSGTISATYVGIALGVELTSLSTFFGGISNSGLITARTGIYIGPGVVTFAGGVTNSGTILDTPGGYGIRVDGGVDTPSMSIFSGGVSNSGYISAVNAGIFVDNVSTFSGGVTNSGTITASNFGIAIAEELRTISTFLGGISNSGVILASTGIRVGPGVTTFLGGITNTGTISGVTGIVVTSTSAVSVFDSGVIIGTGGTAIDLSNNATGNTFTLGAGYSITGNVRGQGSDTFQLGGDGSANFDLTSIGPSAQYQGFTTFNVVGGVWNTTGTFDNLRPETWNVLAGTLAGASTFGTADNAVSITVANGATLEPGVPGTAGGIMTISGDLTLQQDSIYLVNLDPVTASRANVSGNVTIDNAILELSLAPGVYSGGTVYDILDPPVVAGKFFTVDVLNYPGFTGTATYEPNEVLLNLTAQLGFGQPLPIDQHNAATGINTAFNNGSPLPENFLPIFKLSGTPLVDALSQVDGEDATGAERSAFNMTDRFLELMLDPFVDGRSGAGWPGGGDSSAAALGFAPDREASVPPDVALAYTEVIKGQPAQALPAALEHVGGGLWRQRQQQRRPRCGRLAQCHRQRLRLCRRRRLSLLAGHGYRLRARRRRHQLVARGRTWQRPQRCV